MRLELGSFPAREVVFGDQTRWQDGRLEIDRAGVLAAVRRDPRLVRAELDLAQPGESVRIWPVRDVVEPRVKVAGPGVAYPGVCGRPIETVGQGRTHRLAGVGVVEVSDTKWYHSAVHRIAVFVDMSGPWAELVPQSRLFNVCLVAEPDRALSIHVQNQALHQAALTVADRLAAAVKDLEPPEVEVFELGPVDLALPRVVYLWGLHSPQAMSGSLQTFCTSTYGLTQLTSPWLLHPNEALDGAINGPYRTAFATSWGVANNALLLELYRRHGVDLNFLGCIVFRTEWTTQHEKQLMANQAAKMAKMVGADGAVVTWDASGNEAIEVMRTVQACERVGVKTVLLTVEDYPAGAGPTLLEPLPEADAIVSSGYFQGPLLLPDGVPGVDRVIGWPTMVVGPLWDQVVDAAGRVPLIRYDDHYGFGRVSCFVY